MKRISKRFKILLSLGVVGATTAVFFTNCAKSTLSAPEIQGMDSYDSLLEYAWHIKNSGQNVFASTHASPGVDLNLINTWSSGVSGAGIKILISDDSVEDTHEDLSANFLSGSSKDYTLASPWTSAVSRPRTADDNHGTAVAGLAVAVAGNGVGTKGVAFDAQFSATNFLSSAVSATEAMLDDQAKGNFDIFNMSWGSKQNTLIGIVPTFHAQMAYGVTFGRANKGSIYVKSAGNNFVVECRGSSSDPCIGNANFDADNVTPYTVLVGAMNASGYAAEYSSPGSNLWISAFGGEQGYDSPAMVTTDRMGCSNGFSTSTVASKVTFDRGYNGNTSCNYTVTFNGTSAAAPTASGAIALLLQANPNLTWRDVKYILAKTAYPADWGVGSYRHPLGESLPSGAIWEQAWVTNTAGFKFHNWYGFGKIDVDKAVAMAKNYTSSFGAFINTNWIHDRSGLSLAIPDNSATGVSDTMVVNENLKIEGVQLQIWATHTNLADLALELKSPSGTKSILINMNNALRGLTDYEGEIMLSNAFYQERAQGTWTLKVIDGKSTHTGTVTRWRLNFFGSY
ncbi:S8 family serine peptidase [Bdellovibrio sp. 22V]|uniref:S8 family serine peptidase n=1 Tax=Bdellovibrio TaxID=958 RepID=UPI0025433785|nr:S8 family serine peptidase [Bdellovibrio sp. 22V]WII72216.1 S8 family serine peptidase [Bdellovibrio sp. 22V]